MKTKMNKILKTANLIFAAVFVVASVSLPAMAQKRDGDGNGQRDKNTHTRDIRPAAAATSCYEQATGKSPTSK